MNGKTYRECSQHATCHITKSSLSILYSLVDRGSNIGVSGSDVRVIETHTNCKVYIRVIDNHDINAIPLVTAGGVTSTITGEKMLIIHQHAQHGKKKTIH